ncbi:hypothetical protein MKX03_029268, partial [Papaver bracteatum]
MQVMRSKRRLLGGDTALGHTKSSTIFLFCPYETFEFLNLLRVHGMPEVMGVLTYLDSFKNVDDLEKTKEYLKDHFKTEISETAEVFCLCGVDHG